MNDNDAAQRLARLTGADNAFFSLAELITRRAVAPRGHDPADPDLLQSPQARLVQAALNQLYPAFAAFYASLFIKHVGEAQALGVLEALQREPMRHYLRARIAMQPALAAGVRRLTQRMDELAL